MKAYQESLEDLYSSASNRSCFTTKLYKVKGLLVVVHSGIYNEVTVSYCNIEETLLKEASLFNFRPLGSYTGLQYTIYSKSPKSLLALVRKHLKEQL